MSDMTGVLVLKTSKNENIEFSINGIDMARAARGISIDVSVGNTPSAIVELSPRQLDIEIPGCAIDFKSEYETAKYFVNKELKSDKSGGSTYYSWQSNLAMIICDNSDIEARKANEIAKKFLDRLIGDE